MAGPLQEKVSASLCAHIYRLGFWITRTFWLAGPPGVLVMPGPLSALLCAEAYRLGFWLITGTFWLAGPPGSLVQFPGFPDTSSLLPISKPLSGLSARFSDPNSFLNFKNDLQSRLPLQFESLAARFPGGFPVGNPTRFMVGFPAINPIAYPGIAVLPW